MQTFLPYNNFVDSARVLDPRRLGKQRVEALQILRTLKGETNGWKNHPAVLMWKGYENALISYGVCICNTWIDRGYKDTCGLKMLQYFESEKGINYPPWLGDNRLHFSHKCNLYRKDPEYYESLFGIMPADVPYYWPVRKEKYQSVW